MSSLPATAAPSTLSPSQVPQLALAAGTLMLSGHWHVNTLAPATGAGLPRYAALAAQLTADGPAAKEWDLRTATFDSAGALLVWRAWGHQFPAQLLINPSQRPLFEALHGFTLPEVAPKPFDISAPFRWMGSTAIDLALHVYRFVALLGQCVLDFAALIRHPSRGPWREISANIYRAGASALPITALVGFLIGIVLSYLTARQLKVFGAGPFIVDLLGVAIIRELGPVIAAILVAGRSGSAMTAQIGVMRVTEELDALRVMGIPRDFRLVLPKVIALAIAMPLLVVWTDIMALLGGIVAAKAQLGLGMRYFTDHLPQSVQIANFWLGVAKGSVFGVLIALIACHFGLRVAPNTESLSAGTTQSVVSAITVVILVDALFAVLFSDVGI